MHWYTHEIINNLSTQKLFSAVLAVYLLLRLFYNMLHCNFNEIDKLRNCVTAPDVHPYFLTPHLFCHNGVLAIRHTNDCV